MATHFSLDALHQPQLPTEEQNDDQFLEENIKDWDTLEKYCRFAFGSIMHIPGQKDTLLEVEEFLYEAYVYPQMEKVRAFIKPHIELPENLEDIPHESPVTPQGKYIRDLVLQMAVKEIIRLLGLNEQQTTADRKALLEYLESDPSPSSQLQSLVRFIDAAKHKEGDSQDAARKRMASLIDFAKKTVVKAELPRAEFVPRAQAPSIEEGELIHNLADVITRTGSLDPDALNRYLAQNHVTKLEDQMRIIAAARDEILRRGQARGQLRGMANAARSLPSMPGKIS